MRKISPVNLKVEFVSNGAQPFLCTDKNGGCGGKMYILGQICEDRI